MRILIQTLGSAGDVHPMLALGRTLRDRGHEVIVWANEHFAAHTKRAGLEHRQAGTDALYREVIANRDLWHPMRGLKVVLGMVQRHLIEQAEALRDEILRGETVILAPTLGLAALMVREKERVPTASVHLAPSVFQSCHRVPRLPGSFLRDGSPTWLKKFVFAIGDRFADGLVRQGLDAARASWGLPPVRRVFSRHIHSEDLVVCLFPEWFGPRQPDWPKQVRLFDFPRFDEAETRPLSEDLERWLRAGEPPIAFTAGSANLHTERFFEISLRAARRLGRRALLLSMENPFPDALGDDARHEIYAPFSTVLPRCAAFVSHGGIGSSSQALAAGIPQLVTPMGFDQFDNASRLEDLDVGVALPMRRYRNARKVANALQEALGKHARARAVAEQFLRFPGEHGLEDAAEEIERLLERHTVLA